LVVILSRVDLTSTTRNEIAMTHEQRGRTVENTLAYGGFALFALYVLGVEIAPQLGFVHAGCPKLGVPWGVLGGMVICVAPKTLGRARAAGVLDQVMQFVPGTRARKARTSVPEGPKEE
jgi:hypothetical protein